MHHYDILVSVSEKWTWKCSKCGTQNFSWNTYNVRGMSNDFFTNESNAKEKCLMDVQKQLDELVYQYSISPYSRNYRVLNLCLSCDKCYHAEPWATSKFSAFVDTAEKKEKIRSMSPENLPSLIEYKFTPVTVEERKKQENKRLIIGACWQRYFLSSILSSIFYSYHSKN